MNENEFIVQRHTDQQALELDNELLFSFSILPQINWQNNKTPSTCTVAQIMRIDRNTLTDDFLIFRVDIDKNIFMRKSLGLIFCHQ